MKILLYLLVFIQLLLITSCNNKIAVEMPEGFEKINDTIFIQQLKKTGENKLTDSTAIVVEKYLMNEFDIPIPFATNYSMYDTMYAKSKKNAFWKIILSHVNSSDSAIFCLPAKSFLQQEGLQSTIKLATSARVYLHIYTKEILSPSSEIEKPAEELVEKIDSSKLETKKASTTISNKKTTLVPITSAQFSDEFEKEEFTLKYFLEYTKPDMLKHEIEPGYYLKIVKKGTGEFAKRGDIVTIAYEGRFLNGKKFDDSSFSPEPFEFELGKPDQILKGLEKAIYKMQKGSRAVVYFSSRYGYGAEGSVTGIVGKYNSLTFAVHLKKINTKNNERN